MVTVSANQPATEDPTGPVRPAPKLALLASRKLDDLQ
jgi:hypothetical protein